MSIAVHDSNLVEASISTPNIRKLTNQNVSINTPQLVDVIPPLQLFFLFPQHIFFENICLDKFKTTD